MTQTDTAAERSAHVTRDARQHAEQTTEATVIASLKCAHVALVNAAERVASRYGVGCAQAQQIAGAAAMISEGWIPAIERGGGNG
jgi:hypothetical protein